MSRPLNQGPSSSQGRVWCLARSELPHEVEATLTTP